MLLITSAFSAASLLYYVNDKAAAIQRVMLDDSLAELADQPQGQRVMNILLVGSDSSENLDENSSVRIGRQGENLGDAIIIAHIDERTADLALLSLPRDLWVEIPGTGRSSRINKAFESGGPATLVDTIEANFDIPIHHYVNVDFAGFQGLVDAVGTVEVYFDSPARDWNVNANPPRTQTGFLVESSGCKALDPEQSLAYVRSRYYQTQQPDGTWSTDLSSDLGRVRRQQDFLRSLMKKSIQLGARNPFVLSDLMNAGLDNVTIDETLTPQLLKDLAGTYQGFNPDSLHTYSMPAVDAKVGNRLVLKPVIESAEPLLDIFRGSTFIDKNTVLVKVSVSEKPSKDNLLDPLAINLQDQGFVVLERYKKKINRPTENDYLIQHGPDGQQAAQLVADSLSGSVAFEQIAAIDGRNIQLIQKQGVVAEPSEAAVVKDLTPAPLAPLKTQSVASSETTLKDVVAEKQIALSEQSKQFLDEPEACG